MHVVCPYNLAYELLQVAHRFYNSHAIVNAAVYLTAAVTDAPSRVRVVIGHYDDAETGAWPPLRLIA